MFRDSSSYCTCWCWRNVLKKTDIDRDGTVSYKEPLGSRIQIVLQRCLPRCPFLSTFHAKLQVGQDDAKWRGSGPLAWKTMQSEVACKTAKDWERSCTLITSQCSIQSIPSELVGHFHTCMIMSVSEPGVSKDEFPCGKMWEQRSWSPLHRWPWFLRALLQTLRIF